MMIELPKLKEITFDCNSFQYYNRIVFQSRPCKMDFSNSMNCELLLLDLPSLTHISWQSRAMEGYENSVLIMKSIYLLIFIFFYIC